MDGKRPNQQQKSNSTGNRQYTSAITAAGLQQSSAGGNMAGLIPSPELQEWRTAW
jgi:hypothetical protein